VTRGGRLAAAAVLGIVITAVAIWGALALWYALPAPDAARMVLALLFAALGLGGLLAALRRRRLAMPLSPFALAVVAVLVWWSAIEPSNDRAWQTDVARLSSAEIDGDRVTLRNVRGFEYRSATDYTARWYDRTVDLRQLDALDLIAVYWMGDAIAHTMLSFGFAGEEPVTISIETRKERDEEYSALAGFFRRYELYYVVGDERDLIGICCIEVQRSSSAQCWIAHAARPNTWCTKARWAEMSLAGAARTCPLASIAIASTPARVRRAVTKRLKPSMGRVRRLIRRWSCSTRLLSQRPRRCRVKRQSSPARFIARSAPG
jgi:Domain of unknown function (DUF4105)